MPASAFENAGPAAALKRSASISKQHWNGQVVGMADNGGGVFLLVMLPSLVLIGIGVASPPMICRTRCAPTAQPRRFDGPARRLLKLQAMSRLAAPTRSISALTGAAGRTRLSSYWYSRFS